MASKPKTPFPKPAPRFLIVEDNWQHAEFLTDFLEREFGTTDVRLFETVKKFQLGMPGIAKAPPDVIILDMMVSFTDPDDPDSDTDVVSEDFFTAGARCFDQLRQFNLTDRVIVYSVIDKENLRQNNLGELAERHVQKSEDKSALFDAINRILKAQR